MILLPNTKRLKELIKLHGATQWREYRREPVACFNGAIGVFIESADSKHTRWVRENDLKGE